MTGAPTSEPGLPGRPNLSTDEAEKLALELFSIRGTASDLPSDRDQNFSLDLVGGKRAVLKISNANENPAALACQEEVMSILSSAGLPVPSVLGKAETVLDGVHHHARLVSWLEGTPLGLARPITPALERSVGHLLAETDRVLEGFQHAGAATDFVWDLAHAMTTIEARMDLLPEQDRGLVQSVLDQFRESVGPRWDDLPKSVIHSDANDYNILVGAPLPSGSSVHEGDPYPRPLTGLLDFGDIVYSARVGNVAVAAAYLALHRSDPVEAICQVVRGYHEVLPLTEPEIEVVFALVRARLAISVCMSASQRAAEPDNAYLSISEKDAWACLSRLDAVHPRLAGYRIRHALGLEPVPGSGKLSSWLQQNRATFQPVIHPARPGAEPVVFDFSVGSLEFDATLLTRPGLADEAIWRRAGDGVGIGRWNEPRLAYAGGQYETASGERRTVHLGVDLFRPAGTPVHAPLDAIVHSSRVTSDRFDYGGCIVLEHRPGDGGPIFWTLYGHLSHESVRSLEIGSHLKAGQAFARLGAFEENGGWVPHLHFQVVTDLLDLEGTYPGVAAPDVLDVWLSLSPSPIDILGLPAEAETPPVPGIAELMERRNAVIGRSLSVSYAHPLHIVRGWEQFLYDASGRAYLDAVNNVPHVGHSNPRVVRALHEQMQTLTTNTRYLHEQLLRYAERLTATLPDSLEVCFLVNSGSEANDLAIRLARTYTGKEDMIVLDGAYHGNLSTLIGISPYKFDGRGGSGKPAGTHVVRMPDPYRGEHKGMTLETGAAYAQDVAKAAASGRVAAFIAESVPGCGGQIVPPPGYFTASADAVRRAGGVFIADEVQIGLGRAGTHFWGFELDGVIPDIVVIGKPIGNGHPMGAVVTTREIADAFNNGMEYFNTFGGNPASCAVGLAVLDEIEDRGLQKQALDVGNHLLAGLASLAPHHDIIGDVRGVGLFLGVELVRHRGDLEPADEEASYVANRMRDNGILISTDGPLHNVLKIKPPLVFTRADADHLVATLGRILSEDFVRARVRAMPVGHVRD